MNRVVWFDIPVKNVDVGSDFYRKVFGWNVLPRDPSDTGDELSFRAAQTAPSTTPDRPDSPGAINGGIVTGTIGISHPTILLEVEDIAAKLDEIVIAGGKIVTNRRALPLAYGYFAYCEDPDGNVIGLWEWEDEPAP
jgi:predicted enzyme related to lactoylglutathione lyase